MKEEVKAITDHEIQPKIEHFEQAGGCVKFELFEIVGIDNEYERHSQIALQTLRSLKEQDERYRGILLDEERLISINEVVLMGSGLRVEIKEFFGPLFDLDSKRVLVKGRNKSHVNDYFFHDRQEDTAYIVDEKKRPYYQSYSENFVTLGFTGAFLDPPHTLRCGDTIFEKGDYFLKFCDTLFGDLEKLVVYKWSTDSSNIFDSGKEWWGSFFWTVYSETKNHYIGIVASTTD